MLNRKTITWRLTAAYASVNPIEPESTMAAAPARKISQMGNEVLRTFLRIRAA